MRNSIRPFSEINAVRWPFAPDTYTSKNYADIIVGQRRNEFWFWFPPQHHSIADVLI